LPEKGLNPLGLVRMTPMQPNEQIVKVSIEIGPGLPTDVGAFHGPHAFRALLTAFYHALTAERVFPQSVFTGTSNGIEATLSPTHYGMRAEPTLPTSHYIECTGTVKLVGEEQTSEVEPVSDQRFEFPIERRELDAMKTGRRHEAVVPVLPNLTDHFEPGAKVTFFEVTTDLHGTPIPVPKGDRLTVTVTKVKDQDYQWAGRRLYYIAWDPAEASRTAATETEGSNGKVRPETADE
jgi:hypothetical protein